MWLHNEVHGHCKRVCTESWLWVKNPLPHWGTEPGSVACQSDALPTELHPHPLASQPKIGSCWMQLPLWWAHWRQWSSSSLMENAVSSGPVPSHSAKNKKPVREFRAKPSGHQSPGSLRDEWPLLKMNCSCQQCAWEWLHIQTSYPTLLGLSSLSSLISNFQLTMQVIHRQPCLVIRAQAEKHENKAEIKGCVFYLQKAAEERTETSDVLKEYFKPVVPIPPPGIL